MRRLTDERGRHARTRSLAARAPKPVFHPRHECRSVARARSRRHPGGTDRGRARAGVLPRSPASWSPITPGHDLRCAGPGRPRPGRRLENAVIRSAAARWRIIEAATRAGAHGRTAWPYGRGTSVGIRITAARRELPRASAVNVNMDLAPSRAPSSPAAARVSDGVCSPPRRADGVRVPRLRRRPACRLLDRGAASVMNEHRPEDREADRAACFRLHRSEDPDREGPGSTRRSCFLKALEEYTRWLGERPEDIPKGVFARTAAKVDEMSDRARQRFTRLCEHHLARIGFGKACDRAAPGCKRILRPFQRSRAWSRCSRAAHRRVRERLTNQDRRCARHPPAAALASRWPIERRRATCMGRAACAIANGTPSASALRGLIETNRDTRREFLSPIGRWNAP